ncbi:MAG: hypothetical protein ACE5G5_14110 [Candidatus Methylomirabilales bacterium]
MSGLLLLDPAAIAQAQTSPSLPIPPRHVRISAQLTERSESTSWGLGPRTGIYGESQWKGTRSSSTFFLLIADGQEGRISVSEDVPNGQWFHRYSLNRGYIGRGSIFQRVSTGFRVSPTILPGDRIRLQITPEIRYFTDQGQGQIAFVESRVDVVVLNGQPLTVAANQHETQSVLFHILRGYEQRTGRTSLVMTLKPEIQ